MTPLSCVNQQLHFLCVCVCVCVCVQLRQFFISVCSLTKSFPKKSVVRVHYVTLPLLLFLRWHQSVASSELFLLPPHLRLVFEDLFDNFVTVYDIDSLCLVLYVGHVHCLRHIWRTPAQHLGYLQLCVPAQVASCSIGNIFFFVNRTTADGFETRYVMSAQRVTKLYWARMSVS